MNMNYSLNPARLNVGALSDSGYSDAVGVTAMEDIEFGTPVLRERGTNNGYKPRKNLGVITFSAALSASNVVNGLVDGVAISPVTFDTSEVVTMNAIKAAIEAVAPSAIVTVDLDNHAILVKKVGAVVLLATWAVTGGTAKTVTLEHTTDGIFAGVARKTHNTKGKYVANDSMPVVRIGRVVAAIDGAAEKDDHLYIDLATGLFTTTEAGNFVVDVVAFEAGSDAVSVQLSGVAEAGFFTEPESTPIVPPTPSVPPVILFQMLPTSTFNSGDTDQIAPVVEDPSTVVFEWEYSDLTGSRDWVSCPEWCRYGHSIAGLMVSGEALPTSPGDVRAGAYRVKLSRGTAFIYSDETVVVINALAGPFISQQMVSPIQVPGNEVTSFGPTVSSADECHFAWEYSPTNAAPHTWEPTPQWMAYGMKITGRASTDLLSPTTPPDVNRGHYRLGITRNGIQLYSDPVFLEVFSPA